MYKARMYDTIHTQLTHSKHQRRVLNIGTVHSMYKARMYDKPYLHKIPPSYHNADKTITRGRTVPRPVAVLTHHVIDEAGEEALAGKVGVVSLQVGSLRARHLTFSSPRTRERERESREEVEG